MEFPRHKKLVIYTVTLLFASFLIVCWNIYTLFVASIISKNSAPLIVRVEPFASASQFARLLKNKHLIHSSKVFLLMIRLEGLSHQLKAGVYQINPGETAMDLLNRVVKGNVLTPSFTIIEGTTQQKITEDLRKAVFLEYRPEDWRAIQGKHLNAEGLLLADTYQYQGGSRSVSLLEQAHQNLMHYLNNAWASRVSDLPYHNSYELLIAASIIEKETAIPQERQLIAGVMVNRLKKRMPLQMDPTVIYGLGAGYQGKLSHQDLQINSPYNSYRYGGLPPTPIAMVGKEAIDAAAHPQMSQYLYFVARGDGSHQFSETYEQQRQAIERYRHKDV